MQFEYNDLKLTIDEKDLEIIDISSIDFTELEKKYAPTLKDPLESVLIVDNVPIVDQTKETKLLDKLKQILAKYGYQNPEGIFMPMVQDPKSPDKKVSKGFLFLECETSEKATDILKSLNGHRLDKNHTFLVNKFNDVERLLAVSDQYVDPPKEEYKEKEHLGAWLTDERARDQYLIQAGDEVTICWNNGKNDTEHVYARKNWSDSAIQWSPLGSYVATFHRQGIALWGGPSWERIARFVHVEVKVAEFSPMENYMITWSAYNPSASKDDNVRVWDVKTGKLLRGFSMKDVVDLKTSKWSLMKWSFDEKFLARQVADTLAVYEVPSMTLVGGKTIKVDGLVDFCWSPANNYISFWTPERENTPARVTILEFPSKAIVRTKNLFMVNSCKIHWQSEGNFMCVVIDRYTKTKKSIFSTIELFFLREKDVPIDVYEGFKERQVTSFEWEPKGDKFIVLSSEGPKVFCQFFRVEKVHVKEIASYEKKNTSSIFWNPNGRFVVLAALTNFQGELEFVDTDDLQTIGVGEHYQVSLVDWDPTGRFVATVSTIGRSQGETCFSIWDFRGQLLSKRSVPKLKLFSWRPRPLSLLTKEQMKNIRKNLHQYSEKFDIEDSRVSGKANELAEASRNKLLNDWKRWRENCIAKYDKERLDRAKLRGTDDSPVFSDVEDEEEEAIEELIEEVIEEHEVIIN